jgi:hypothetical protein
MKLKIWHEGDRSDAMCEVCAGWRKTEFQYRTIPLRKSGKQVDDVLVAVCLTCDSVAAIPQQSAPKLRDARKKEPTRVEARIPKELRDVVGVIALEFGGDLEQFPGGVVRYYLHELRHDATLAQRVAKLAQSGAAKGTPGGRLAFRTERTLLSEALAATSRTRRTSQSSLIRGIIVAAKEDAYDAPDRKRREAMRAIAAAAGG